MVTDFDYSIAKVFLGSLKIKLFRTWIVLRAGVPYKYFDEVDCDVIYNKLNSELPEQRDT